MTSHVWFNCKILTCIFITYNYTKLMGITLLITLNNNNNLTYNVEPLILFDLLRFWWNTPFLWGFSPPLFYPRNFTYKWQFSYFSVLFVPLRYRILSLKKKKKKWEKQLCTVTTTWWNLMCMCLRSFQGHSGGVEHLSFDGSTIISASTDL